MKSETTWPRTSYNVHLQTENGIPKCECWDWRWTHLPCKHMFAVLELLPGTTWSDLPEKFRNSPLYTLDTEVCGFLEVPADQVIDLGDHQPNQLDQPADDTMLEELPKPGHLPSAKKQLALKCREKVDLLRDITYLSSDNVLTMMDDKLGLLLIIVQMKLRDESGLVEDPPKNTASNKRSQPSPSNLPLRKRKKITRVGAAAERVQKNEELITKAVGNKSSQGKFRFSPCYSHLRKI